MPLLTSFFIEFSEDDPALERRLAPRARGGVPTNKQDDQDDCEKAEDASGEQPRVPDQS